MSKSICWLVLLLGTGALLAQQPSNLEPLPAPAPAPPAPQPPPSAPPRTLPESVKSGGPAAKVDLERLRQELTKLKTEREALDATLKNTGSEPDRPGSAADVEKAHLRLRLAELLTKMSQRTDTGKGRAGAPLLPRTDLHLEPSLGKEKGSQGPSAAPNDALALAQALFQAGDHAGALQAYQGISLNGLRPDERAPIQYMIASCYRKLGKVDEALARYREAAAIKGDDFIAECAQWQLDTLQWRHDLELQLEKLKQRRESLEAKK